MGTSTSVGQFALKLTAAAETVRKGQQAAVAAAAVSMTKSIETARNAAIGTDGAMGMPTKRGKRQVKLTVATKLSGGVSNPQALITSRGPWGLIEDDIGRHRITARSRGRGRRARTGFLSFGLGPGGSVRRSVMHPGTTGKHPFEKGVKAGGSKAAKVLADENVSAMRAVFK